MSKNITKIISCADIHIPSLNGIAEIKETLFKFIDDCKKIVNEEGDQEKVRIVVLGDIFHNKITVTNESIMCANWFFSQLNDIFKTIVIAGNHDMLMNNLDRVDSLSSLFEIGKYSNIIYLDRELGYKSGCYKDNNIVWALYSSFDGFSDPLVTAERVKYPDCIFAGLIHADVNGAVSPTGFESKNGLDAAIFKDCDFVMAGHIHKRQEIKKNGVRIVYCSSMEQRDFGESVNGHGYVLWDVSDPDEIDYEFKDIPNENRGYYKFSINNLKDIEENKEELINP